MTWTVSISDLRDNFSDYVAKVQAGDDLLVRDERKDEEVVKVVPAKKKFDPVAYRAMLKRVAGTFTAKNHPEWATKKKVEQWLRKSRMEAERTFDVPPRF